MWVALGWLFGGWAASAGWWWLMEKASRRPGDFPDKIKGAVAALVILAALGVWAVGGWTHPSDCYGSGPTRVCEGE